MMISYIRAVVFAFVTIFISTAAIAAPNWDVVPTDSSIVFTATQNGSHVSGQFKTFTVTTNFDPAHLAASKIKVVIDINSVKTSYKTIEDTLKTADWFDSKFFPQAIFQASDFKKTGDNTYVANGTLKIRDKMIPVTLNFNLEQYTPTKALVKGTTVLKRTMFGVGRGDWAKTDSIKDEVQVDFVIDAVRK